MDKVRLRYLLEKHIADTISSTELDELFALLETTDLEVQEEILTDILDGKPFEHKLSANRRQVLYEEIRQSILTDRSTDKPIPHQLKDKLIPLKRYISIAAVLLIGLSTLLWLWNKQQSDTGLLEDTYSMVEQAKDDIYMESDSVPFLRLPNGEIQLLEGDLSNAFVEAGVKIRTGENGEIIYEVQQVADAAGSSQQENLVFTTPKGQSSKILLIDGTEVWLNSGSSLTYPSTFSGKERRVKLSGEGYFEVAHNVDKPFYVETEEGPLVRVLGTSFNVSAYKEDKRTTTTLVEGSVQLLSKSNQVVLKPNEQVIAHIDDALLRKERVNVSDFISWKDGYFSFNGQSIPEILAEVRRWYNIEEITYTYMPEEKFTGTFKRTKSLKSLLVKLEKISNVKFEIKERRIVVTR